jgi:hypothetical protein
VQGEHFHLFSVFCVQARRLVVHLLSLKDLVEEGGAVAVAVTVTVAVLPVA